MEEIFGTNDRLELKKSVGESKKMFAPESEKIRKVREKLLQQWAKQDSQITAQALSQTIEKIHQWISSNSMDRVPLKNKEIKLFDQNQNAASLSRKIQSIAERISRDS